MVQIKPKRLLYPKPKTKNTNPFGKNYFENTKMNNSEILIYQSSEGNIKIDVRLEEESVWLTQAQLCELFQKSKSTISEHIKNVFEEGKLDASATVRNFRTVQSGEPLRNGSRKASYIVVRAQSFALNQNPTKPFW